MAYTVNKAHHRMLLKAKRLRNCLNLLEQHVTLGHNPFVNNGLQTKAQLDASISLRIKEIRWYVDQMQKLADKA